MKKMPLMPIVIVWLFYNQRRKMKENKVCSLELSKKLKELGVKQESIYSWFKNDMGTLFVGEDLQFYNKNKKICSAFLSDELLEMLPKVIEDDLDGKTIPYEFEIIRPTDCRAPQFDVLYISPFEGKDILAEIGDDTLPNALAKMLIYLTTQKREGE